MILTLFTATCLVVLGIAIGMYIASQIEGHISSRTNNKELFKNLNKLDKNIKNKNKKK